MNCKIGNSYLIFLYAIFIYTSVLSFNLHKNKIKLTIWYNLGKINRGAVGAMLSPHQEGYGVALASALLPLSPPFTGQDIAPS